MSFLERSSDKREEVEITFIGASFINVLFISSKSDKNMSTSDYMVSFFIFYVHYFYMPACKDATAGQGFYAGSTYKAG